MVSFPETAVDSVKRGLKDNFGVGWEFAGHLHRDVVSAK